MIAFPTGVKVWIAGGVTDMRRRQRCSERRPSGSNRWATANSKSPAARIEARQRLSAPLVADLERLNGRICLTNNAAERSLRGVALGRKSWLFAGSERGGQRAAAMYSLIGTAKLNGSDPQAWRADVGVASGSGSGTATCSGDWTQSKARIFVMLAFRVDLARRP